MRLGASKSMTRPLSVPAATMVPSGEKLARRDEARFVVVVRSAGDDRAVCDAVQVELLPVHRGGGDIPPAGRETAQAVREAVRFNRELEAPVCRVPNLRLAVSALSQQAMLFVRRKVYPIDDAAVVLCPLVDGKRAGVSLHDGLRSACVDRREENY